MAKFPRSIRMAHDTWIKVAEAHHWDSKSPTSIEGDDIKNATSGKVRTVLVTQDLATREFDESRMHHVIRGHSYNVQIQMVSPNWKEDPSKEQDQGTWQVASVLVSEYIDGAYFSTYYSVSSEGDLQVEMPRHQTRAA